MWPVHQDGRRLLYSGYIRPSVLFAKTRRCREVRQAVLSFGTAHDLTSAQHGQTRAMPAGEILMPLDRLVFAMRKMLPRNGERQSVWSKEPCNCLRCGEASPISAGVPLITMQLERHESIRSAHNISSKTRLYTWNIIGQHF